MWVRGAVWGVLGAGVSRASQGCATLAGLGWGRDAWEPSLCMLAVWTVWAKRARKEGATRSAPGHLRHAAQAAQERYNQVNWTQDTGLTQNVRSRWSG